MIKGLSPLPLLVLAALGLSPLGRAASTTYRVTQKIGALPAASAGTYSLYLDFQLSDGAQNGVDDSTVRIQNVALAGGTVDLADRSVPDTGLITGTNADFTLHNSLDAQGDTISERALPLTFGASAATLTYDFTLTSTGAPSPIPDAFVASLLYRTGPNGVATVVTLGPTYGESVAYAFDGSGAPPEAYAVDPAFVASQPNDTRFGRLGTPTIAPVPEPAPLAALALGAACLLRRRRR